MAVGNSFDLWQKDVFFSAAEEVQESTDIMESVYRRWLRERNEGHKPDVLDELRRELQTALGTAKWQLEEFERAVRRSHENSPSDKSTITRHSQFIVAIEDQISHAEKALGDSLIEGGSQPLRWVQLDEEERNDLALFLSARPQSSGQTRDVYTNGSDDCARERGLSNSIKSFKECITFNNDGKYIVELEAKEVSKTKDEMCGQREENIGQNRTWSSPDIGAWKIAIAGEENEERKPLETRTEPPARAYNFFSFMKNAELTTKAKWLRNSFGKEKNGDHRPVRQGISSYLDLKGVTRVSQHHIPGYYMQLKGTLRVTLLLVLSMLLVVTFVLYST
uniref:Syntaxin-61 n=1 Tax=Anthurium amnicola TaxID=1678845 RepID=A0A1D1XUK2_9ARAE